MAERGRNQWEATTGLLARGEKVLGDGAGEVATRLVDDATRDVALPSLGHVARLLLRLHVTLKELGGGCKVVEGTLSFGTASLEAASAQERHRVLWLVLEHLRQVLRSPCKEGLALKGALRLVHGNVNS